MNELDLIRLRAAARARQQQVNGRETDQYGAPRIGAANIQDTIDGRNRMGEKAAAFLNKAGESMTLGLVGDEAAGKFDEMIGRGDYEERRDFYRDQEQQLEEENPGLALGADVAGAIVPAMTGVGAIGRGMAGMGIVPQMIASGASTGAMSGVYGFAEGEGGLDQRMDNAKQSAALGAGLGAVVPLAGRALQGGADAIARSRASRVAQQNAPTTEQLRAMGRQAYQAVDDAGVQIKPEAFSSRINSIGRRMADEGLDNLPGPGSLTPQSARALEIGQMMGNEMAQEPTAALPFSSLDKLRRHASTAAGNMSNKTDSALGSKMVGEIDDFVKSLTPDDLAGGDPEALKSAITKARDTWARMSRSQTIDSAIDASENYLSNQTSGLRNQFARILRSDKLSRGFSDAEKDMMRQIVQGSASKRVLDLLGGGLGTLASIGTGAGLGSAGGPVGSALGALIGGGVAGATTKASEAITRRQAEALRAIIANGGLDRAARANPAIGQTFERLLRQSAAAVPQ